MAEITTGQIEEPLNSALYVLSLSDFFMAYAAHKERTFVPAPAGVQKIRQNLHMLWIDVISFLGSRKENAPHHFFHVESEKPDPMKSFLQEMRTGTILSIGFELPRSAKALPVVIPKEVWRHPDPDFKRGTVSGAGFSFAHVQIVMNAGFPEAKGAESYIVDPLPEVAPFRPSEDSRSEWDIHAITAEREKATVDPIRVC